MKQTIDLTPNYTHMFHVMLKDAQTQGKVEHMFTSRRYRQELLREVQRWFAPLTIAVGCAATVAEIEQVRTAMTEMLYAIDQEVLRLEQEAYDAQDDGPTDEEGLL